MGELIKQYKNLIMLVTALLFVLWFTVSDPLGTFAERRHHRALIYNQIAVERAETDKRIAIIKASMDSELIRIRQGL